MTRLQLLIVALGFSLALLGAYKAIEVKPALCAYCPSYTCYGSCPSGCVCITGPGQVGGNCYSIE